MTSVQFRVDIRQLTAGMSDLAKKQVPFALAKTLNGVLIDGQKETIRQVSRRFLIRRPDFLRRTVKMVQFANRQSLTAVLAITGPSADIFAKFEEGGTKTPTRSRALAVPREVKRNKREMITKGKRPRGLDLKLRGTGPTGTQVYQGKNRTFAIRRQDGTGVILQRYGRGKRGGTRVLYSYVKSARLQPQLEFFDTVGATYLSRFPRQWDINFAEAVRTAR